MTDYFQWECPDCEDVTNGTDPEPVCRFCGQGNIIRNIGLEEAIAWGDIEMEWA